jgi:hypothetical protein
LERNGMRRSLTPDNIRIAHKQSLPTVIQAVEGGHFLQGPLSEWKKATGGVCGI